jgi:hypothetical protein
MPLREADRLPSEQRSNSDKPSEAYLDPTVNDPAFEMGVNLGKGRVIERGQNDGPVLALTYIGQVFAVNEQADLSKGFFAKQAKFGRPAC